MFVKDLSPALNEPDVRLENGISWRARSPGQRLTNRQLEAHFGRPERLHASLCLQEGSSSSSLANLAGNLIWLSELEQCSLGVSLSSLC